MTVVGIYPGERYSHSRSPSPSQMTGLSQHLRPVACQMGKSRTIVLQGTIPTPESSSTLLTVTRAQATVVAVMYGGIPSVRDRPLTRKWGVSEPIASAR